MLDCCEAGGPSLPALPGILAMDGVTTMVFALLHNLGVNKFNALQTELARGKAPLALARTIQSEWGG
jgi:hypothetical protein